MRSEGINWLYSSQQFGIKLGLETSRRLLREFAQIDPKAPPFAVLHIAGTNGKGSTSAFAESLLRHAGLKTGLFTSPHLLHYRERIRVNFQAAAEDWLEEAIQDLQQLVQDWNPHPTFFELTLALAGRYFVEEKIQVAIMETGMGGRLDATNAMAKQVAAITPIGLDHAQWLGETLPEIAAEKAGIFHPNCQAISAQQAAEVYPVLQTHAKEHKIPLEFIQPLPAEVPLGLAGEHQRQNAALALAAVKALGHQLSPETQTKALQQTRWPGRFERRILANFAQPLILDGAHNPHAAEALRQTWQSEFGEQKALLIAGFADKDLQPMLQSWSSIAEVAHFVPILSERSHDPEQTVKLWRELKPSHQAISHKSLQAALDAATKQNQPILIAGSLYLIAQATELL